MSGNICHKFIKLISKVDVSFTKFVFSKLRESTKHVKDEFNHPRCFQAVQREYRKKKVELYSTLFNSGMKYDKIKIKCIINLRDIDR